MKEIPIEKIDRLVAYDPETGGFTWRERTLLDFADRARLAGWNTRFANKPAATAKMHGYPAFSVAGYGNVLAHRAAFALTYGRWPAMIDHINGDKSDNRISNLREVTPSQNQRNRARSKNNTSGLSGVRWDAGRRKWSVAIWEEGKSKRLGRFSCFGEAARVRAAALREAGFSARHGI